MPELPEVETIRRIVAEELIDQPIEAVDLRLPKLLRSSPLPSLDELVGRRIAAARRRAKILVLDLDDDRSLLVHFKLAGQLAVETADGRRRVAGHPVPDPAGPYPHRATHLILAFAGGARLYHSDVRQFGWVRYQPTATVPETLAALKLGPEAVGPEMIGADELGARLSRRTIPLKSALLDQHVLAGLGNIYADEALHHAGLHPLRLANSLDAAELVRLHAAIAWALERGLEQGGAKIVHNRAHPRDGFPRVHALAGAACAACGAPIVKIRVGGRGTYLCPVCQPAPSGAEVGLRADGPDKLGDQAGGGLEVGQADDLVR